MSSVADCRVVELPIIERREGSITPVEGGDTVPFDIARVYYIYDVVAGSQRGGHAHRELESVLVAVMGAFTVALDDGRERRSVELNRAYQGLYVPPLVWRELRDFSHGAICVVLASIPYAEEEYVREYESFLALTGAT